MAYRSRRHFPAKSPLFTSIAISAKFSATNLGHQVDAVGELSVPAKPLLSPAEYLLLAHLAYEPKGRPERSLITSCLATTRPELKDKRAAGAWMNAVACDRLSECCFRIFGSLEPNIKDCGLCCPSSQRNAHQPLGAQGTARLVVSYRDRRPSTEDCILTAFGSPSACPEK